MSRNSLIGRDFSFKFKLISISDTSSISVHVISSQIIVCGSPGMHLMLCHGIGKDYYDSNMIATTVWELLIHQDQLLVGVEFWDRNCLLLELFRFQFYLQSLSF